MAKHLTIPDDWAIRKRMNKVRGIGFSKMTPPEREWWKREDMVLKE